MGHAVVKTRAGVMLRGRTIRSRDRTVALECTELYWAPAVVQTGEALPLVGRSQERVVLPFRSPPSQRLVCSRKGPFCIWRASPASLNFSRDDIPLSPESKHRLLEHWAP